MVRAIINEALWKWQQKKVPADNIAVLIAFLTEASVEVESGGPAAKVPVMHKKFLLDLLQGSLWKSVTHLLPHHL